MKPVISFADFDKIELKVGTVLEAEAVEDSNKLVKLLLDLGSPDSSATADSSGTEKRQIIAGIRKSYEPEKLIGTQIVVVANLEPRALAGLESLGMVLAAHDENGLPVVLHPEKAVPNGSEVN